MRNIPPQFGRVRPGAVRTLPLTGTQTMLPGEVYKLAFTGSASAAQTFRAAPGGVPQFVSIKTTADVYVVFGDASIADPSTSNALIQPGDSWQDFMLLPGDTSFKALGVGGGNLYLILSSQ